MKNLVRLYLFCIIAKNVLEEVDILNWIRI